MPQTVILTLSPQQAADQNCWLTKAAHAAGIERSRITSSAIVKRSVDARRRPVTVNLVVSLCLDGEVPVEMPVFDYPYVGGRPEVVIVGGGPAGLFCALRLIELGYRPVVLERGNEVATRRRDVAELNRSGLLHPDSNYAFGEGGAGTFSDGKLFTRSKKRGDHHRILEILVYHGADPAILFEAHPHIGTDKLPAIMTAIRRTITACGGEVRFRNRVTDFVISGGHIEGVMCGDVRVSAHNVVLATGHSAVDIYELAVRRKVLIQAKPFAVGVRVEHPQQLIDEIQYHGEGRDFLPAAAYTLTAQVNGRGVYSFCMCPGGVIVPAMTSPDEVVVNGMSASARSSRWANSGIVTEVRLDDFAHLYDKYGELAGLQFRTQLEHIARQTVGRTPLAPAQRLTDFVAGRFSSSLPSTSYAPGVVASRMDQWLPQFISDSLRNGFKVVGRRMHGFLTDEASVIGVETRTSAPIRIPRDPVSLSHISVKGLYPAGEGAGYAGGIVSAALDGVRIAEAIARNS